MPEDLKRFEAVLGEWAGLEFRIMTIAFSIEDENDAIEVAGDIALLEGSEVICVRLAN